MALPKMLEAADLPVSLRRLVRGHAPRLYSGLGRLRRRLRGNGVAGGGRSLPGAAGRVDGADRELLEEIRSAVGHVERPDIALLNGGAPSLFTRLLAGAYPGASVREYDVRAGQGPLHPQLAAHGPFHVIVDDTAQSTDRVALLCSVFFHSRHGGLYVVRHHRRRGPQQRRRMTDFVARLVRVREGHGPEPATRGVQDLRALADAVGRIVLHPRNVVLTCRLAAEAKLREEQVDQVLLLDGRRGRVVSSRPGLHFDSLAGVSSSRPDGSARIPVGFDVPSVSLREYVDVVCRPGQVLTQGNVLLPDTYRHNHRTRLVNGYVEEVAPAFGRPRDRGRPEQLDGIYF